MAYNTNQDRLADRTATSLEQSLGKNGIRVISGTTSVSSLNGVAIQFVTTCTISALTVSGVNFGDVSAGGERAIPLNGTLQLVAGTVIYGNVTAVTLGGNGQVAIVYNA